jgi:hypothetical protein
MKLVTSFSLLGTITAASLMGQKLETHKLDPTAVMRVETAKDHLTVIELRDPVTMVAIGNQSAFVVERRENKVFVKPTEDGAQTNLFIWTNAGRYAYELTPAQAVEKMHFAIDQAPTAAKANLQPEAAEKEPQADGPSLPQEMLTHARPILVHGERETEGRVEISLRDLFRKDNRLYLRYAVVNHSAKAYQPSRPAVWQLTGVRSPQSLIPLRERQLGEKFTRTLRVDRSVGLHVIDAEQSAEVAAGDDGIGWVALEEPKTSTEEPTILKLRFAADARGEVNAMLVVRTAGDSREVANVREEKRHIQR